MFCAPTQHVSLTWLLHRGNSDGQIFAFSDGLLSFRGSSKPSGVFAEECDRLFHEPFVCFLRTILQKVTLRTVVWAHNVDSIVTLIASSGSSVLIATLQNCPFSNTKKFVKHVASRRTPASVCRTPKRAQPSNAKIRPGISRGVADVLWNTLRGMHRISTCFYKRYYVKITVL